MKGRREFLKNTLFSGAAATLVNPLNASFLDSEKVKKLTVLYTNDTHSRIDPFPADHHKFPGMGGFAQRASLIGKIKEEEENVLLLDAGDIFQGTPFFNFYGGEPEFRLMSAMQYDCVTLGNHDFDNGTEGLFNQMKHARFEFVNTNYNLLDTPLSRRVKPYQIFNKGGLKIGVYGLGVNLEGLVNTHLRKGIVYTDPLKAAIQSEKELKYDHRCDLIICLSHLGFSYKEKKISDKILAPLLSETNLIIGGHTHTFLDSPIKFINKSAQNIYVTQVGWAGLILGRFDYLFDRKGKVLNTQSLLEKIYSKTTLY